MHVNTPFNPPAGLEDLQAAYVTGEPGTAYAQGILAKYGTSPQPPGSITPFSGGVTPATMVPTGSAGQRYPYYSPFADNEELYAGAQTWYSKAGNGLLKGAGLALSTFANGTLGLIAGTMSAISDGRFASLYDNEFSRALDNWNKDWEDRFPNYYTHAETSADWYTPANLLTANFLFDKVIKNLGYSVGAIAAGMTYAGAFRSIGLFSKVASAGGLGRTAAATEELIATVPQTQRASAAASGIRQAANEFLSGFNTLNTTQRVIASGLATIGEANFEALMQLNDYRRSLIASYGREKGIMPAGEDLDEINRLSENAGNLLFGLNTLLLTASNYVQFPKILGSSYRAERNIFNSALRETGEITFDKNLGRFVAALPKTKAGKVVYRTGHLAELLFSPTETFEELSQSAFNFGVTNYFDKARAGRQTDILSDLLGEGYRQALTTKEGLESLLIGGFSGGIMELRSKVRQRGFTGTGGIRAVNTQAAVNAFNERLFTGFLKDTTDAVNRGARLQLQRMQAINQGDILESKDLETDFTHNYLAPRIKYGRYDLVKDDIAQVRQLAATDQGLQQLKDQGIITDDTTREQLLARLEGFSRHADNVHLLYQALNTRYSGLKDSEGRELYPAAVIDKMVYASAKIADYDQRIPALSDDLVRHGILVQPVLDSMATSDQPSADVVKTALDQISGLDTISETKEQLRNSFRDLVELGLRRKHFLKEYDQLKGHPEDYLETKYGPATEAETANITIPQTDAAGSTVQFPVETGKSYALQQPLLREGNRLYPTPSLQVHEQNLLGELLVTGPTGEESYALPGELQDYNLLDPLTEMETAILRRNMESALDETLRADRFKDLVQVPAGATFDQKMAAVNQADSQALADELERRFKGEIEKLRKVSGKIRDLAGDNAASKAIQAFFDTLSNNAGTHATSDPEDDRNIISQLLFHEGAKKHISVLFRSSTSETTTLKGTGENDDFHRRANKFLNNLPRIAGREHIRVAVVTVHNQQDLGLEGLIPATVPGTGISAEDTDEGIIRLVFIRSTPAGDHFVAVDGNNLVPVGQKPDFRELVYTTLPSTSLTWRNGETRYITNGPNAATAADASAYQESWRIKRAELLALRGQYETYPFSISRGFPEFAAGAREPVVGKLVTRQELSAPVLVIPTHASAEQDGRPLGTIIHNEESLRLPLGRPVLQTPYTLLPLNNRKLTPREKRVLGRLVPMLAAKAATTGKVDEAILDYLRGLLFWKAPAEDGRISSNQVWFSNGYLYLGSRDRRVPFIEELITGSPEFAGFLDSVFVSANNFLLTKKSGEPFNEIIDIDESGQPVQVQWKSYQHFLLDDHYTTTPDDTSGKNGAARPSAEIPFTTDVVLPGPTTDKYDAPFQQKYIILHDFDLSARTAGQPAPALKTAVDMTAPTPPGEESSGQVADIEEIIQAGDFILDGRHMNTIYYKDRALAKVAATFTAQGVQFGAYEHLGKKELTPERKQAVLELATVAINNAVVAEVRRRQQQKDSAAAAETTAQPAASATGPAAPETGRTVNPTAEDVFKNLSARRSSGDITGGQYRMLATTGPISREDLDQLAAYHARVLPDVPLHIVEQLIRTTDGGYAWGALRDGAIYLYRHAELGTGYHEIFESVYHLFLSAREQQQIIGELRRRPGNFVDRETGSTLPYRQATDHQAKEQMAEEFKDFVLRSTLPPGGRQRSFFRRLLDFIRRLLLGRPLDINALFQKIHSGYYSRMPVPYPNRPAGEAYSTFIPGLGTKFIHDTMQGMTALVFEQLFSNNSNIIKFDEGIISLEELYGEVFRRLETHFTRTLPENLLADIEEAGLDHQEAERAKNMYREFLENSWKPIRNNWRALTEINRDFLRPFQIVFENDSNQDELEAAINNPGRNDREYERDILRISARKNASTAIKLLFATLTQVEQLSTAEVADDTLRSPARKLSSLKLPLLVNYAATFNRLLYAVSGTNGLGNILSKIKELASRDSTYVRLYKRLKVEAGFDSLGLDDWKLLLKLFAVTSKQKPGYLLQVTDEGGRVYMAGANDNLQTRQLINGWLSDLKAYAGKGKLVYIENNRYRVDPSVLQHFDTRSVEGKRAFLDAIGIHFTAEQYAELSPRNKTRFNDGAQRLFNQLSRSQDIATISGRALGISGALTKLAEAYVSVNGETTESQHFNIEGEPVQNLVLGNYVSYILQDINAHATLQELKVTLPHLGDVFSRDSLLLEKGGPLFDDNGNRRADPLQLSIMEGSTTAGTNRGVPTSSLTLAARRMQEFNQNLNGIYNVLVPADSKTEWCLDLQKHHYIPYRDFANPGALSNKIYRIFSNYLRTEFALAALYPVRSRVNAISRQGSGLRFFKDILPAGLVKAAHQLLEQGGDPGAWIKQHEKELRAAINEWVNRLVQKQFDFFREYEMIIPDASGNFRFSGIDGDFVEDHKIAASLSEKDVKELIRFRTLNYVIHNIELHKVFFGDPALYTDATKRIKSFLSGREVTYHTDADFDRMANIRLNRTGSDENSLELEPGDPGYHVFRDYMPTVTAADIEVVGSLALQGDLPPELRQAYENVNEADAQSWMRLSAYRELLHKAGGRWTDAMEEQYQYEHAYERLHRARKGTYAYKSPALKDADQKRVAAGNPHAASFYVIKPIGTGIKHDSAFMDLFLDKTSTMPMFYRLLEGTPMEEVYLQMQDQDISYLITASGRKIGAEDFHALYNPDGSINPEPFNNRILVPYKYYGIQVETGSHGRGQTRGSQLTKLATMDLMENEVPVDVDFSYEQWMAMDERSKKDSSPIYRLVARHKAILEALTAAGYRKVLHTLGIEETADGYRIPDKSVVVDFLKAEVERRELPQNLKDAIDLDPATGDFALPLEALPNYKALKNIIYSVVDRNMLSPLMPGGPKVQVSSAMFERNRRQAVYRPAGEQSRPWQQVEDYEALTEAERASVRLTSSDLKFYNREAPYMEVYMPHWFGQRLRNSGFTKTDKELLDYLNNEGSELLDAIGFRIPTQGPNSIERIRIKGFLPAEFGDTIIVPSEITVKAGSDFDIDKLNTYLKHFYLDRHGWPQPVTLHMADTGNEQELRDLYEQLGIYRNRWQSEQKYQHDRAAYRLIERIFGLEPEAVTSPLESVEEFMLKNKGRDIYDLYSEYGTRALENEYIRTLEQLLALPQNFERLVQPNSADQLKHLRDELNNALGKSSLETKGNFSLLLDPMYLSEVRHNFLAGKGGVGIAALQQTGTALSQLSTIILDPENYQAKLTDPEIAAVQNLEIRLPHNSVTISGKRYVTLSGIRDTADQYISDKISAYINGYVDVAKDPFLIELGAGLNVASTFMFLERIGVPMRDVIFFMNQPIVRDFLKAMEIAGLSTPVSAATMELIGRVKGLYPASSAAAGLIDTSALKGNIIKKAHGGVFTARENAAQQQILDEFLKYTVLADHLFQLTQGYNYDTANFSESALIYRKQQFTARARSGNLFSGVDKILNTSFIGKVAGELSRVKDALGEIFMLDRPRVAAMLEQVLSVYVHRRVPEDDYLAIAARLQASFLDYLTQVHGQGQLNMEITPLLLSEEAVAGELAKFKTSVEPGSDLGNNIVLRALQPLYDDTSTLEPRNVKLVEKAYDAYTYNLYTEAMRELRDNIHSAALYKKLVKLSLVQSGVRRSPISFTDIIPVEDYAPFLADAVRALEANVHLDSYADNFALQRAHWADERIVPTVTPKEVQDMTGAWIPMYSVPPRIFRNLGIASRSEYDFIQLNTHFQSRELTYPVVKIRQIAVDPATGAPYTPEKQAQMRKNGDYSFLRYKLYQQVLARDSSGAPVPLSYPEGNPKRPWARYVIYKQINAWGKPGLVQEYYDHPRSSVLPSNIKVTEIADADVVKAFLGDGRQFLQLAPSENEDLAPSRAGAHTLRLVDAFLERAGVDVKKVGQIVVGGRRIDANGVADIIRRLIQVVDGKQDTVLPEEAMHFAVEILEQTNPALFNRMMREVGQYHLFDKLLSSYGSEPLYQKDGKPDIYKIKKEAIARVLVETIIRDTEGSTEKPELLAKAATWWQQILDWLKRLFGKAGFNPFQEAAGQITAGSIGTAAQLAGSGIFASRNMIQVNAAMKVVAALRSEPVQQAFVRFYNSNSEKFYSVLQGVAPRAQVDMLRQWNQQHQPASLEEMIEGVLSQLSYVIEIRPSVTNVDYRMTDRGNGTIQPEPVEPDIDFELQYDEEGNVTSTVPVIRDMPDARFTQEYVGYTVPGGTAYMENEIRTPQITPLIKGHAKFATDQGIGWFRSDNRQTGNKNSQKTRRILEVQSDLFQKGRGLQHLVSGKGHLPYNWTIRENPYGNRAEFPYVIIDDEGDVHDFYRSMAEAQRELFDNSPEGIAKNRFLQLLNKDGAWISFFIRAVMQDSARKGYAAILFPTGRTAEKIQGLTYFEEIVSVLDDALQHPQRYYIEPERVYNEESGEWSTVAGGYYSMVAGHYHIRHSSKEAFLKDVEEKKDFTQQVGNDSKKPLHAFYEVRIPNILKKLYPDRMEPVTDEHGNTWFQVGIETSSDLGEFYFQLNTPSHQQTLSDKLLNVHRQLSKVQDPANPSESHYVLHGRRIPNRVTNLSKKYYESKFRNKQITETELQKALSDQKREKGFDGHSDLEDIFHRMVDDNGYLRDEELVQTLPSRLDPADNSFYKTLEANMRERLRSFKPGTRFFSELMIYDAAPDKDEAGTIDFLAIEPDNADGTPGKVHILDWKFIDLRTDAKDVPWYKREAWNIQISEYARILQTPAYGARKQDFGLSRAIPIRARYTFESKEGKIRLYSIDIGGVDVKAIDDDTLLPVPIRGESTGNKELDNLISSLENLSQKIYETRSEPGTEYRKIERLNELVSAIRRLHVKKEAEKLFEFAKADVRGLNEFFKRYFVLVESGDQPALDALDINDLSRKILDAEDTLALYREFGKTFRRIFDPAANKPLLQEAEKISDNAEIVRRKLLDLANALRSNPIARGAGIQDMLHPEKAVTWYQKWVRSLSQGATKATQILWNIVNAINTQVAMEFSDEVVVLKRLEAAVSGWIKTGGRSFSEVENLILAKDNQGRWNGKVISRTDPSFYNHLSAAKLKKDKQWVYDNIDLQAYNQWYAKTLAERKETYQHSRLHEDDQRDQEIKQKRLQEFEMFFDIMQHPDTAITGANLKLNSYPDLTKWKSAALKELEKVGNEPILALYQYWEKQLERSYELGMIKAWERKTFFPNVRKDFLDKIVFGSGDRKLRRANLGFLDSIRIDVNDEVFGYTDINGNPQDKLSALYVYDLGERITLEDGTEFTDYSNKSTDLFKVMALWAKEMAKYKHKSRVVDTVRLLYLTEQNRKALARSKRTGAVAVRSDGSPVLIDNVENSQYLKNFMDYYFFGKRMSEGQDVTFSFRYNRLADKVNKFFGSPLLPKAAEEEITVSGKKLISATNRFFQMKTLGLNLATAVTNYMGGKANAYMLAGRFFTKADYTVASLKLASANFHTPEGKIYAGLLNYFLPLTDDRTRQQVRDLSVSRAVRLLSSDHLFYLMRTSDMWVQYPAAIAFFDNTMVEDGKLVNIREYVKQKNGYDRIYDLPREGQRALREKIEKEVTELKNTRSLPKTVSIQNDKPVITGISRDAATVHDLRNRIQQFSKDALGNMSEEDISQYRLTLLGQSFMMFKNWIPRMADVRFGEFRYQAGTDAYEWGRVSMLFNALRHSFLTGASAALGTLVGRNDALIGIAKEAYQRKKAMIEATGERFTMTEAEFIDMYIKGVRTQLKEVLLMASMIGLLLFARSQAPDDDDSRTKGAYRWTVRTIDKMTDELGFFYNPLSFTAIANGSIFPSVQILNDLVKLVRNLTLESFYLVTGDEEAREKNKVTKYLFKTFPITKEMMMYTAIFNEDLAKEYGITISTNARRNW